MDEATKAALENSLELKAERHRVQAIEAQVEQVAWAPFSRFEITAFASVVPNKEIQRVAIEDPETGETYYVVVSDSMTDPDEIDFSEPWGPTLQFEIRGGVPLYTFGKISSAKDAVAEALKAKEAELPRFEYRLRELVAKAYHAVEGAREMLYTIKKGREYLDKARKKIEEDLENEEGETTQVDLIKIKVFEGEVDQYEAQAKEIESIGLSGLRFLVGSSDAGTVDIVDKPQQQRDIAIKSLEDYKKSALDNRPELEALRHAVRAMKAKVRMRKADFWPNLVLVGGWRVGYTPGRPRLDTWFLRDGYNYGPGTPWFGLALDYPLDFGMDKYRLDETRAELAALSVDQKRAMNGVILEVEKAYHHLTATKDAIKGLERSKKLVKGWIAAVTQSHAAGLSSAKEVKDALEKYFGIMAALHKLVHDFNVGVAELERVTGTTYQSQVEISQDPA